MTTPQPAAWTALTIVGLAVVTVVFMGAGIIGILTGEGLARCSRCQRYVFGPMTALHRAECVDAPMVASPRWVRRSSTHLHAPSSQAHIQHR